MGQYYRPILTNSNGNSKVYNRNVDGKYTMAKLMEHSWWDNPFVNTICKKLFHNPTKVVWCGDYANDIDDVNEITTEEATKLCEKAWNNRVKGYGVKSDELKLDNMFLVNHTKKIYVDCNAYKEISIDDGWCVHPLPLLTALGNCLGGGDYCGVNEDKVGSWANDVISIEKNIPDGYTYVEYVFVDR